MQDAAEVDVDTGMPVGTGGEVDEALEVDQRRERMERDDGPGARRPSGSSMIDAFMADRRYVRCVAAPNRPTNRTLTRLTTYSPD